jgi:hypothetical protein
MTIRLALIVLAAVLLSGCSSIFGGSYFGGSSSPGLAYVGDLAEVRSAHEGDTIAYAKSKDGEDTFIFVFKGVDGKGGIHIARVLRETQTEGRQTGGVLSWITGDDGEPSATELVFLPEQTLLVSPGVHVVFIKALPGELQYRVVMVNG